jgi:hypothetical protein
MASLPRATALLVLLAALLAAPPSHAAALFEEADLDLEGAGGGCRFTFYPKTIPSQNGDQQLTGALEGAVKTTPSTEPGRSRINYKYSFIMRLLSACPRALPRPRPPAAHARCRCCAEPINPRLCRWLVTSNTNPDVYYPQDDTTRKAWTPENGFDRLNCMLNPKVVGNPVNLFPCVPPRARLSWHGRSDRPPCRLASAASSPTRARWCRPTRGR